VVEEVGASRIDEKPVTAGPLERVSDDLRRVVLVKGISLPSEAESVFRSGALDSFGLVQFVEFSKKGLHLQVLDNDLLADSFETIHRNPAYLSG